VGVGDITFGMSRAEVISVLGKPEREVPPDAFYGDSTLLYDDCSLAVCVDANDQVCAVESRGCSFIWEGRDLRGEPWSSLRDLLQRHDPDVSEARDVVTSRRLGLAANTADDETPQGITAFRAGYYDRPRNDKVDIAGWFERIARERQS
jgi:hypothetical protein